MAGAGHAPALGVVAVALTFAGALDAVDALSEELDHPDLQRGYPIAAERLALHHLTIPLLVMTVFCSLASGVAGLLVGVDVVVTGLLASPLAALAAVAGAGLTATRTARPFTKVTDIGLPVEAVAPRIVLRVVAPVIPLALMVLPMIETHDAGRVATLAAALPGAVLSSAFLGFVLVRARLERVWTTLTLRLRRLGPG